MTRRHLGIALSLAALVATALAARPAQARLIDLRAGGRLGGQVGWGTTAKTPDFFDGKGSAGGGGFQLGVKLLVIDLSIDFTQLFNGATFSQALLGVTFDIPVGNQVFQGGLEKGKSRNVIRPILNGGVAFGTPETISLPLDDGEISQKGFVTYFGVGYEHFLNEFLGVGAQVDYGWHYFVGGGRSMFNSMTANHSAGYQLNGFATLTFHLGY